MRVIVRLPQLSMGMSDAEVVEWHVAVGETVAEGDDLVDVEGEKAVSTVVAPASGMVHRIDAEVGDVVEVRGALAVIETGSAG